MNFDTVKLEVYKERINILKDKVKENPLLYMNIAGKTGNYYTVFIGNKGPYENTSEILRFYHEKITI
jgi:hypothetical protein